VGIDVDSMYHCIDMLHDIAQTQIEYFCERTNHKYIMMGEPDDTFIRYVRITLRIYMIMITMVLLICSIGMLVDGHVIAGSMILAGTLSGVIQISIIAVMWAVLIN
jgi:hypothetical protein